MDNDDHEPADLDSAGEPRRTMALLLAFDCDDVEFARGFEAGRTWALLSGDDDQARSLQLHASNAEMAIRIAEATGRPFRLTAQNADWIEIEFGARDELGLGAPPPPP